MIKLCAFILWYLYTVVQVGVTRGKGKVYFLEFSLISILQTFKSLNTSIAVKWKSIISNVCTEFIVRTVREIRTAIIFKTNIDSDQLILTCLISYYWLLLKSSYQYRWNLLVFCIYKGENSKDCLPTSFNILRLY